MKQHIDKLYLVCSIIFLAFFCYVFYFLYVQIITNDLTTKEIDAKWKAEFARREEIKSLEKALDTVSSEQSSLESHFVKSSDLVSFLNNMEDLGKGVSATAETTDLNLSSDKSTLVVRIKAEGNFESIYKFITLLENYPYQIEFSSLDVVKDSTDTASKSSVWKMEATINLLSFTYNNFNNL